MAMGIESFFVLQPIDFAWLRKIRGKRKSQLKAQRLHAATLRISSNR
jgi:hypothetical protein